MQARLIPSTFRTCCASRSRPHPWCVLLKRWTTSSRWCAATFMRARIAPSLSVWLGAQVDGEDFLGPVHRYRALEVMSTGHGPRASLPFLRVWTNTRHVRTTTNTKPPQTTTQTTTNHHKPPPQTQLQPQPQPRPRPRPQPPQPPHRRCTQELPVLPHQFVKPLLLT